MTVTALLPAPATFDDFWSLYPSERRKRKKLCRKMWDEITGGGRDALTKDAEAGFTRDFVQATPDEILAGLKAWRRTLPTNSDHSYKDPEFIVTSPVWLNQGRWEDAT